MYVINRSRYIEEKVQHEREETVMLAKLTARKQIKGLQLIQI